MSLKTIEATGQKNESKYRSGRGTGLLLETPWPDGVLPELSFSCIHMMYLVLEYLLLLGVIIIREAEIY